MFEPQNLPMHRIKSPTSLVVCKMRINWIQVVPQLGLLVNAEARVRAHVSPCGICGEQLQWCRLSRNHTIFSYKYHSTVKSNLHLTLSSHLHHQSCPIARLTVSHLLTYDLHAQPTVTTLMIILEGKKMYRIFTQSLLHPKTALSALFSRASLFINSESTR